MDETNLTQHGRGTDVYALDIPYPWDTRTILKKTGIYQDQRPSRGIHVM